MQLNEKKRGPTAGYPNIPDHSDLRGFSYRAPTNYQWSDDHDSSGTQNTPPRSHEREYSQSLWSSVRNFLGRGPKGYRRPDSRIHEDACEALMLHPGIDASQIEVEVKSGIVTLRGMVPDRWMKRASEWVVDRISGVEDVNNLLDLQNSRRTPQVPDEEWRLREIQAKDNMGSSLLPG